jgi:hypothetical protein
MKEFRSRVEAERFGERLRLRVQLLICDGCGNFTRQMAFLRRAVQHLANRD